MSTIHFENWDSATPPAIPAGWNCASQLITSTAQSYSSPNSLALNSYGSTYFTATWGTADSVSGNVMVTATVLFGGFSVPAMDSCAVSTFARCGDATCVYTTSTFYEAKIIRTGGTAGTLYLNAVVSGSPTTVASVFNNFLQYNFWYQVTLVLNAATQSVLVQRMTDGMWLTASGTWSVSRQNAITAADSSIAAADGYAGVATYANLSANITYFDDWTFAGLSAPAIPPNPPIVGRVPYGWYPANLV